MTKTILTVF